ncbi:unnamed protein product [Tuber aestivum]|uniref:TauD/TfdA-like domain-containing protein n=1 Tax=Tuber aestivum TaxID=59557 RepID=A0A292Q036_9PEZI|nr:unnamed protein product [Tuber aestivum]
MLSKLKPLATKLAFLAGGVAASMIRGRVGGDISPVYPSLSGIEPPPLLDRYAELKRLFTAGRERTLTESRERRLLDLGKETAVVRTSEVEFEDLCSLSKEETVEIKKRGAVVLKNVSPDKEALVMRESLKAHRAQYLGSRFPSSISTSLLKADKLSLPRRLAGSLRIILVPRSACCRAHPSPVADTSVALPYADRFRIRQSGDAGFALRAHFDGGSEEYDSYNADHRVCAKMGLCDGAGNSGV